MTQTDELANTIRNANRAIENFGAALATALQPTMRTLEEFAHALYGKPSACIPAMPC